MNSENIHCIICMARHLPYPCSYTGQLIHVPGDKIIVQRVESIKDNLAEVKQATEEATRKVEDLTAQEDVEFEKVKTSISPRKKD